MAEKPVAGLKLTERMGRKILLNYCLGRTCEICIFGTSPTNCKLNNVLSFNPRGTGAPEVFDAVKILAGGDGNA